MQKRCTIKVFGVKVRHFGYWICLGDLSNRFVLLCTSVLRHDTSVGIGVSGNKKKWEKRKGRWWKEEKERRRGNGGGSGRGEETYLKSDQGKYHVWRCVMRS